MGRRKAFIVRVEIDIHSVQGQGLGLCHADSIALSVTALDSTMSTMTVRSVPGSPVRFGEKLRFEKVIDSVATLTDVQDHLTKETVMMDLIQWPRDRQKKATIVAHFRTKLTNLLFHNGSCGGIVNLLMEPAEKFAEFAWGKVEVSTKTMVEETNCRTSDDSQERSCCCGLRKESTLMGYWPSGDCSICRCYSGYFDPRPYHRSRACIKDRSNEHPISYRELFYENLDCFYRKLCNRKCT